MLGNAIRLFDRKDHRVMERGSDGVGLGEGVLRGEGADAGG